MQVLRRSDVLVSQAQGLFAHAGIGVSQSEFDFRNRQRVQSLERPKGVGAALWRARFASELLQRLDGCLVLTLNEQAPGSEPPPTVGIRKMVY